MNDYFKAMFGFGSVGVLLLAAGATLIALAEDNFINNFNPIAYRKQRRASYGCFGVGSAFFITAFVLMIVGFKKNNA